MVSSLQVPLELATLIAKITRSLSYMASLRQPIFQDFGVLVPWALQAATAAHLVLSFLLQEVGFTHQLPCLY